jgi:hypothetical protein
MQGRPKDTDMPYHLEFDKHNKVLCTSFEGRLSFADWLSARRETLGHILEKNPAAGIWDYSHVDPFDVTPAEIGQMASRPSFYAPGVPQFSVASSDHVFETLRMFQMLSKKTRPELQVVRTREEAYKMLGIKGTKYLRWCR